MVYIDENQLRKPCYVMLKVYWFLINPAMEHNQVFSQIAEVAFQLVAKQMGIPPIRITTCEQATEFINFKIQEGVIGYDGTNFFTNPPSDEELYIMMQNPVYITDYFTPSIIEVQVSLSSQTYFTMVACPRIREPELLARISILASRYFLLWWFLPTRWLANILLNRVVYRINKMNRMNKKRFIQ